MGVNTSVPTLSVSGHTAVDAGAASVREGMSPETENSGQGREGRASEQEEAISTGREGGRPGAGPSGKGAGLRETQGPCPKGQWGGGGGLRSQTRNLILKRKTFTTSFLLHGFEGKYRSCGFPGGGGGEPKATDDLQIL